MLHVCLDDSPRFKWIEMQQIDSTNNFLRNYRATTPLTLVTAEHQTAGRGQVGNTWESNVGENLLCSFAFTPTGIPASEYFKINQLVSLAVRDACQEFLDDLKNSKTQKLKNSVTIKWPNDIYVDDRKLAGILIETEMSGTTITRVIAGIGINVNQTTWQFPTHPFPATSSGINVNQAPTHPFPATLSQVPTPVSLKMLTANDILVRNVLEQLVGHLQRRMTTYDVSDYMSHLYRRDGFHTYADVNGPFQARIADILHTGHLILEDTTSHRRQYAFKEVTYIIANN